MKYCFGDIVIVEENLIGVIVKCWMNVIYGATYDVYVRNYNMILNYEEDSIRRYMVRHEELNGQELEWQENAERGSLSHDI